MTNWKISPQVFSFRFVFRLADSLLLCSSFYYLSFFFDIWWREPYLLFNLVALISFNLIATNLKLYHFPLRISIAEEAYKLASCWILTVILSLFFAGIMKVSEPLSRLLLLTWGIVAPIQLLLFRFIAIHIIMVLQKRQLLQQRNVAVVGKKEKILQIQAALANRLAGWARVSHCYIKEESSYDEVMDNLIENARENKIDIVYIVMPFYSDKINQALVALSETSVEVAIIPGFYGMSLLNSSISYIGRTPVINLYETSYSGTSIFVKWLEDKVLSIFVLLSLSWLFLITGVLIKATSKGPVFFRQTRYGLDGQSFKIFKFRTMYVNEDDPTHIKQATKEDSRITGIGRFLRRTSIDELPQLINVLRGEMSLVGPRPMAVAHNEKFKRVVRGYMLRHKVKPGITGLAQVNGCRGEVHCVEDIEKRVEYDIDYIRRWSIGLDIKILFRTWLLVFWDSNAY